MKPSLVLTVGLPRAGKSTWSRQQGYPVVNPDSIRLAIHGQPFLPNAEPLVWAHARLMVRSLFNTGHPIVILDATNTTKRRRDEWRDEDWHSYVQVFSTSKEECIRRTSFDGREDLIPVIERMARQLQVPGPNEQHYGAVIP